MAVHSIHEKAQETGVHNIVSGQSVIDKKIAFTGHTIINTYAEADLMKCRSQHTGCSSLLPYYLILQELPITVTVTKLPPICRLFGRTLK